MSNVTNCDVLIVGAGPCGLFASLELVDRCSVVLIDAGVSLTSKKCWLEDEGKCKYCRPVCSIMGGFGGAQFFEGTKLSRFPAGSGLLPFCQNRDELERLYDEVDFVMERFGKAPRPTPSKESIEMLHERFHAVGIDFKYYNAQKISKASMMNIALGMYRELVNKGADIRLETTVQEIKPGSRGFTVITDKGVFQASKVLLAVGRLGSRRLVRFADDIGIAYDDEAHQIELGVRVEGPYRLFADIDKVHNDIKLKLVVGHGEELRSFCQDYRGFLTKCVYNLPGDRIISTLDGHLIGTEEEGGRLSQVFNLAVHHRFPVEEGQNLDQIYERVRMMSQGGRPICQDMRSFLSGDTATHEFSEPLSINDTRCGNVAALLPGKSFERIRHFIKLIDQAVPGFADDGNAVVAPSFEMGWKRMSLSKGFETSVRGLYIGGDATGHFRGAMQAAVSGLLAGRALAAQQEEHTWKRSVKVRMAPVVALE